MKLNDVCLFVSTILHNEYITMVYATNFHIIHHKIQKKDFTYELPKNRRTADRTITNN